MHFTYTHTYSLFQFGSHRLDSHNAYKITIEHVLCTCTKYEHDRKQYFPDSQLSRILLHSAKRNIFIYLTNINLLTKPLIFKARVALLY